ncbi:hypothetical protein SDJN03_23399, partial [Cucurbita argyrosperma subsp. sororia]
MIGPPCEAYKPSDFIMFTILVVKFCMKAGEARSWSEAQAINSYTINQCVPRFPHFFSAIQLPLLSDSYNLIGESLSFGPDVDL